MENPPESSMRPRSKIPTALLGMLALVASIEWFLGRHDQPLFSTNAAMSWRFGGKQARSVSARADVLCFGDSQVQFALLPRLIEQQSGLSAYNLALHAAPPPASFFLFQRTIRSGAKPKAVVVDFQAHVLGMRPAGQARLWSEFLDPGEMLDLAWSCRDPSLFADLLCGRLLSSYRDRHEIRASVIGRLAGNDLTQTAHVWLTPLWRNWRVNRGANIFPSNPGHDTIVPPGHWLAPAHWTRDPATLHYMKRFLDLARAEQIPVFWLLPPVHPAVIADRQSRGLEAMYTAFVEAVQQRYPEVVVLDARDRGYDQAVFSDLAHLDREGASVLSLDVGAALAQALSQPPLSRSWVLLPTHRTLPRAGEVEDLHESRVALRVTP